MGFSSCYLDPVDIGDTLIPDVRFEDLNTLNSLEEFVHKGC